MAALRGSPSDVLCHPTAGKDARGMWLKCGAKPSAMPRAATRKEWLKYWNCGECCSAQYLALVLTMNGAGPYNHLHSARRPLTARLRASEASYLCVERTSEKKSEVQISSASRLVPGGWKPQGFRAV